MPWNLPWCPPKGTRGARTEDSSLRTAPLGHHSPSSTGTEIPASTRKWHCPVPNTEQPTDLTHSWQPHPPLSTWSPLGTLFLHRTGRQSPAPGSPWQAVERTSHLTPQSPEICSVPSLAWLASPRKASTRLPLRPQSGCDFPARAARWQQVGLAGPSPLT